MERVNRPVLLFLASMPAYSKLADLEVVGGLDLSVDGAQYPFPLYASLKELLDRSEPVTRRETR